MRNVTITLADNVARWARIQAARHDTSVSRLVGDMLKEHMALERSKQAASKAFFSIAPRSLRRSGKPLPARDELHDRAGLR